MIDVAAPKIHLLTMLPGERFRLVDDPAATVYQVASVEIERYSFCSVDGHSVSTLDLFAWNHGSLFVYPVPKPGNDPENRS